MKNKILIIVTFLALLLPVKVFADTIEINQTNLESTTGITVESDKYTFATGEYKLTSNLDLGGHTLYIDGTNVTIDLNGFDITSTANDTIYIQSNSTVLLKGQGNINNESTDPYAYKYTLRTRSLGTNMSLTIDGPTILKQVYALANMNGLDDLHFHIKSGTIIGSIITRNVQMIIDDIDVNHLNIISGNVTINGGYFHSNDNFAVIYNPDDTNSTLTINDGRFISTYSGGVSLKPVGLTIKKGVFEGGIDGIAYIDVDSTFDPTSILAPGSYFSTSNTQTHMEVLYDAPTNNPQTGDNIMLYITMLGLSIIGIISLGLYTRKNLTNE